MVSELVTNAIDHARGEIELHVAVLDGLGVRIEVADGSPDSAVVAIPPARPDQVGRRAPSRRSVLREPGVSQRARTASSSGRCSRIDHAEPGAHS